MDTPMSITSDIIKANKDKPMFYRAGYADEFKGLFS